MAIKRFKEVRRGFVDGVLGLAATNSINVLLDGEEGLGFDNSYHRVLFMEVFLLAISPQTATAAGCLIRRAVYRPSISGITLWEVKPEIDHRDTFALPADPTIINIFGVRTTPFPNNSPEATTGGSPVITPLEGSYPLETIDFSVSGSSGNQKAEIQYTTHDSILLDTTKVHYQITMEGFQDDSI